jgi:hypothetical protein
MEQPQFVLDNDFATKKLDRRALPDLLDNRLSNGSWGALGLDITAYDQLLPLLLPPGLQRPSQRV